jgi:glycosyltransferase involved in cell wall biosynthesis
MQFSIIIPAKNEEQNIGRCVDSIQRVKWEKTEFEIIVVDNGSSDRTVDIAREKGAQVFVRPGVTVSALRNYGASQSSGRILVFLDADCGVPDNWLEEGSRYLEQRDVVCFGSPPGIDSSANWVQRAWYQVRRKGRLTGDAEWLESMNMFVRKESFESVGGFREDLVTCEDYDLSLRLKRIGRVLFDQRIAAVHFGEAATIVHFWRKEFWRGTSNLKGFSIHGLSRKELPSLIFPVFHCLCALAVTAGAAVIIAEASAVRGRYLALLILIWQAPLMALAAWKSRNSGSIFLVLQLYILLNIYFTARGSAMLRHR